MGIYEAQLISLMLMEMTKFYSVIDFVSTNMHTSVVSQKIHRPSKTCKGADSLILCVQKCFAIVTKTKLFASYWSFLKKRNLFS